MKGQSRFYVECSMCSNWVPCSIKMSRMAKGADSMWDQCGINIGAKEVRGRIKGGSMWE